MRTKKPILLLEDDHVDVKTVQRAFQEVKIMNQLIVVSNGEEGLSYLQDPKKQKPCLILLDLNMPKMNGFEFLGVFNRDATLKKIPVVILTTSKEEKDKCVSYRLGIAGYMIKPVDYKQFVELVKVIDLYWTLSETPEL